MMRRAQSLPATANENWETTSRRSSTSSVSSKRSRKRVTPINQSTFPSIIEINQLLRKRKLQAIWLEPSKENVNHECVCIWREKGKEIKAHHFEMEYYTCRCSMCSKFNEPDEIEDMLHLVDFLATMVLQPESGPFRISPDVEHGNGIMKFEDIAGLKQEIQSLMEYEEHPSLATLLQKLDMIVQQMDQNSRSSIMVNSRHSKTTDS